MLIFTGGHDMRLRLSRELIYRELVERQNAGKPCSAEAIAEGLGCSRKTVWSSIQDLQTAGKIRPVKKGGSRATVYEFLDS